MLLYWRLFVIVSDKKLSRSFFLKKENILKRSSFYHFQNNGILNWCSKRWILTKNDTVDSYLILQQQLHLRKKKKWKRQKKKNNTESCGVYFVYILFINLDVYKFYNSCFLYCFKRLDVSFLCLSHIEDKMAQNLHIIVFFLHLLSLKQNHRFRNLNKRKKTLSPFLILTLEYLYFHFFFHFQNFL